MASVPAYLTAGKIENETLSPTPVGTCRDLSPLHSIPGAPDDARLSEAGARPPSPLPSSPIEIRKSKFENQINPPIPSINHQLKQPSTQIDQRLSHNLKPLAGGSPGKIVPLKPIPAPPEPKTEDHWAALNKLINTPDAQGNCGAGVHLTRSSILP
jgi:hypothetical protein